MALIIRYRHSERTYLILESLFYKGGERNKTRADKIRLFPATHHWLSVKEEKGVAARKINCSIIPKYNETQQKSYIHRLRLYFLIN